MAPQQKYLFLFHNVLSVPYVEEVVAGSSAQSEDVLLESCCRPEQSFLLPVLLPQSHSFALNWLNL